MLMDMGRVSTAVLREALETGHLEELPDLLAQAVEEAGKCWTPPGIRS